MATTASIGAPAGQQGTVIERSLAVGFAVVATVANLAALVLGPAASQALTTLAVTPRSAADGGLPAMRRSSRSVSLTLRWPADTMHTTPLALWQGEC